VILRRSCALLWAGLISLATASALAQGAATVTTTTGTVVVQKSDGSVRAVAPGSVMQAGDILITQPNSTARLKFTDGGDVSVAANSQFRVDAYSFDQSAPQKDSFTMSLLKGGLRTVTGLVGKRGDRDAYKVQTSTATIGIRGTEFIAALCDEECKKEATKTSGAARAGETVVAARVAVLNGEASASDRAGVGRALKVGSPIYEGEVVETRPRSHAVLVFADEGRVTLQPETRFAVERFRYAADRPEQGSAVVRILRGGARALTGLIGKRNPQGYQVQTVTATIGIRGTGFDAFCTGSCESGAAPDSKPQDGPGGLYITTWQDEVFVQNATGSYPVREGQILHFTSPNEPPIPLSKLPPFMSDAPGPRPDSVDVDMQQLFGTGQEAAGGGLYVIVKDGVILLVQGPRVLELERGESAFAGFKPGDQFKLPAPPPVLQFFESQLPPGAPPGSPICTF
jgi:hypothetical protein